MQKNDQMTNEPSAAGPAQARGLALPISEAGNAKRTSRGPRIARVVFVLVLVALAAAWAIKKNKAAQAKLGPAAGRGPGLPPVPVVAGIVARKDVPIYLDGIGTVQAFNTVTVRARVDGQIQKIAFLEGQDVQAGDLLAQVDPDPYRAQVEQAEAKKGEDQAQLANAQVDLKRDAELLPQKIVSQQVYDTQKALVAQLEATVKADEAALLNAKVQLQYTTIVSPIDGRTGIRLIDQGNMVHANEPNGLVVITQLRPISVVFTLPEQTLGEIHRQMASGQISVNALDRDNATVLGEGQLAVIDNQIDAATGTIKLKATFSNSDLALWPGQFVNARLLLTVRKDSAVVPASVVQRGPEGAFAFVIKEDQKVEVRPVKVAQIEQGEALIEEGLAPGERVVVDGQYKLQKGSTVKTADSNAPRPGGPPGGRGPKPVAAQPLPSSAP